MKKLLLMLLIGMNISIHAQNNQSFGVGFVLGAPTGLTFSIQNAQFHLAYSLINEASLFGIFDYKILNQLITAEIKNLFWYLGPGFAVEILFPPADNKPKGRSEASNLWLGVRATLGASWKFISPWELFLEIGPGIYIFPGVQFLGTAGLGIRFYF